MDIDSSLFYEHKKRAEAIASVFFWALLPTLPREAVGAGRPATCE